MDSFTYSTCVGDICITASDRAVTGLYFGAPPGGAWEIRETELIKKAHAQLLEYLGGKRKRFDLALDPGGTDFQKRVWRALCGIPYGRTRSYKQLAALVGSGHGNRAVGAAGGKNPISIFIPCHRVLGADGSLRGYLGGLETKQRLLDLERANSRYFEYGDAELDALRAKDRRLAKAIDGIGFVEYEVIPDLFEALVYNIIGQQISMNAMDTIWRRMLDRFGPITPRGISALSAEEVQSVGITMKKALYIKEIAARIANGAFDLGRVKNLPDDEICRELSRLKGVGVWTAEMLMIFCLERKNILSWNDLAIRRGICRLYGHRELDRKKFEAYRRRYAPYGTIASFYLWALGDSSKHIAPD